MLWKKFEILNYEVLIPPDEVFETFVEVADASTMSCPLYHGNIITQGIPSPFLSVKFLSFFNDSY